MLTYEQLIKTTTELFAEPMPTPQPSGLYEPIAYTMKLGGKRLRPLLLLAANNAFSDLSYSSKQAAIGIELFHNFTLLHDDLMDQSPLRRGMPTVYRKWNANTAILSGDAMLSLAWSRFLAITLPNKDRILSAFNETAIEVYEGQQYDMDFETQSSVSVQEYETMISLKTAALIAGALKIGALCASANDSDIDHLYKFGMHLGIAFQLQDDLLDVYGDTAVFGKNIGTDIVDNKKTYLYIKALQMATDSQRAKLQELYSTKLPDSTDKIKAIVDIYNNVGIKQHVNDLISARFEQAISELLYVNISDERRQPLTEIASKLIGRKS